MPVVSRWARADDRGCRRASTITPEEEKDAWSHEVGVDKNEGGVGPGSRHWRGAEAHGVKCKHESLCEGSSALGRPRRPREVFQP